MATAQENRFATSGTKASGIEQQVEPNALAKMTEMIMNDGYTFGHVLNFNEDQLKALYALGYDLQKRGQYEQAERVLQYLCYLDHYDEHAWIALGYCREKQKNLDGAIQAYVAAGLLDVDNPIPPLRGAECMLQKGELDMARRAATMTLDLAGDDPKFEQRRTRANQLLKIISKRERKGKSKS